MACETRLLSYSTHIQKHAVLPYKKICNTELTRLFEIYDRYSINPINKYDHMCYYDDAEWGRLRPDIKLSLEEIEQIAQRYQIIQLRPIEGQSETLIIGCGNRPLVNAGGASVNDYEMMGHDHPGVVTIDPCLEMNPTLCAPFGKTLFPIFNDHQFKTIIIEGIRLPHTDLSDSELQRLKHRDGRIYINFGSKECYPFSWELNDAEILDPQFKFPDDSVILPEQIYVNNSAFVEEIAKKDAENPFS
jgi:hypothetical protein